MSVILLMCVSLTMAQLAPRAPNFQYFERWVEKERRKIDCVTASLFVMVNSNESTAQICWKRKKRVKTLRCDWFGNGMHLISCKAEISEDIRLLVCSLLCRLQSHTDQRWSLIRLVQANESDHEMLLLQLAMMQLFDRTKAMLHGSTSHLWPAIMWFLCNLTRTWNNSCQLQFNQYTGQKSVLNWHTFHDFVMCQKQSEGHSHIFTASLPRKAFKSVVFEDSHNHVSQFHFCLFLDQNTDTPTMTSMAKENCFMDTAVLNCINTKHTRRSRVFTDTLSSCENSLE